MHTGGEPRLLVIAAKNRGEERKTKTRSRKESQSIRDEVPLSLPSKYLSRGSDEQRGGRYGTQAP